MSDNDNPFNDMSKALEAVAVHENVVTQILTLAIEVESKNITPDRFTERVLDILRRSYKKFIPNA